MFIEITDTKGALTTEGKIIAEEEPLPSSVVLTQGEHGTAWQRWHGVETLWHRMGGGKARTWAEMLAERNLVLVYDAEERA